MRMLYINKLRDLAEYIMDYALNSIRFGKVTKPSAAFRPPTVDRLHWHCFVLNHSNCNELKPLLLKHPYPHRVHISSSSKPSPTLCMQIQEHIHRRKFPSLNYTTLDKLLDNSPTHFIVHTYSWQLQQSTELNSTYTMTNHLQESLKFMLI